MRLLLLAVAFFVIACPPHSFAGDDDEECRDLVRPPNRSVRRQKDRLSDRILTLYFPDTRGMIEVVIGSFNDDLVASDGNQSVLHVYNRWFLRASSRARASAPPPEIVFRRLEISRTLNVIRFIGDQDTNVTLFLTDAFVGKEYHIRKMIITSGNPLLRVTASSKSFVVLQQRKYFTSNDVWRVFTGPEAEEIYSAIKKYRAPDRNTELNLIQWKKRVMQSLTAGYPRESEVLVTPDVFVRAVPEKNLYYALALLYPVGQMYPLANLRLLGLNQSHPIFENEGNVPPYRGTETQLPMILR